MSNVLLKFVLSAKIITYEILNLEIKSRNIKPNRQSYTHERDYVSIQKPINCQQCYNVHIWKRSMQVFSKSFVIAAQLKLFPFNSAFDQNN